MSNQGINWLTQHGLNCTIRADNVLVVSGNIIVRSEERLKRLPFVDMGTWILRGSMTCYRCELTSLEGSPSEVYGVFNCSYNNLQTLVGGPQLVHEYLCTNNRLTTIEGGPQYVKGYFNLAQNNLVSLKGLPEGLMKLNCNNNHLSSLEGVPASMEFLDASINPLVTLRHLPKWKQVFKNPFPFSLVGTPLSRMTLKDLVKEGIAPNTDRCKTVTEVLVCGWIPINHEKLDRWLVEALTLETLTATPSN